MSDDSRSPEPSERAPYEAPRLNVIATVEEVTLGSQEGNADGGSFMS